MHDRTGVSGKQAYIPFAEAAQGNSDRIVRSHLQTVEGQKVLIVDKADELAAPLNGAFDLLPPFHGSLHDTQ